MLYIYFYVYKTLKIIVLQSQVSVRQDLSAGNFSYHIILLCPLMCPNLSSLQSFPLSHCSLLGTSEGLRPPNDPILKVKKYDFMIIHKEK